MVVMFNSPARLGSTSEPFPGTQGPGRRFDFDARLTMFDLWFHLKI